jgi:hypothetical protein
VDYSADPVATRINMQQQTSSTDLINPTPICDQLLHFGQR